LERGDHGKPQGDIARPPHSPLAGFIFLPDAVSRLAKRPPWRLGYAGLLPWRGFDASQRPDHGEKRSFQLPIVSTARNGISGIAGGGVPEGRASVHPSGRSAGKYRCDGFFIFNFPPGLRPRSGLGDLYCLWMYPIGVYGTLADWTPGLRPGHVVVPHAMDSQTVCLVAFWCVGHWCLRSLCRSGDSPISLCFSNPVAHLPPSPAFHPNSAGLRRRSVNLVSVFAL
jgi:hypothetical protein